MKTCIRIVKAGFSLLELLIVIAMLAVLVVGLLNQTWQSKQKAARITCVSHLKQIGLSFRIYAGDNRDRYPMNISTNGEPIVNEATPVYQYFQHTSNELGTPIIVVCPNDLKRKATNNFTNLGNSNISYFIGLDGTENLPQTIVSGDRNITNGFAPMNGILDLTTNQLAGFTDEIHVRQGNIAIGDGSVQQVSNAQLRSLIIAPSDLKTNRIKLP